MPGLKNFIEKKRDTSPKGMRNFIEKRGYKADASLSPADTRAEVYPKMYAKKSDDEMFEERRNIASIKGTYKALYPYGNTDEFVDAITNEPIVNKEIKRRGYAEGTKGIKVKSKAPVRRTEKEKLKARMAAFSDVDNARVAQLKSRSQSGFKGERLNDHGLPLGDNLGKETPVIQKSDNDGDEGAKFRKSKYPDGSKEIKVKKPVIESDATSVSRVPLVNLKKKYSESLAGMSDSELLGQVAKYNNNAEGIRTKKLFTDPRAEEAADSLIARKWRRNGGYKMGTKGIKLKNKAS